MVRVGDVEVSRSGTAGVEALGAVSVGGVQGVGIGRRSACLRVETGGLVVSDPGGSVRCGGGTQPSGAVSAAQSDADDDVAARAGALVTARGAIRGDGVTEEGGRAGRESMLSDRR